MLLNIFNRRELFAQIFGQIARYLILTYADRLGHIFESIFCNNVIFTLAKQQTNRGIVMLGLQNAIHGRKIEVELTCIIGLKFACFQFNRNIATQIEIVEQQVNVEIVAAHVKMILIAEERKAGTQFQKKLGYILDESLFNISFDHILLERNEVKNLRVFHRLCCQFAL